MFSLALAAWGCGKSSPGTGDGTGGHSPDGGVGTGGSTAGTGGAPAGSGGGSGTGGVAGTGGGSGTGGVVGTGGGNATGGAVGTGGGNGGRGGGGNGGGRGAGGNGGRGAGTGGAGGAVAARPCSPPADMNAPPAKLADTGCMDAAMPTKLASIAFPYEVNSPLWSDGADKARGLVLPPGGKIHVKNCTTEAATCTQGPADDGKWVFPVGTVMVKSFGFDGKLVETRLFEHFDATTWIGYTYQWNEAQTEADLVPDDRVEVMFNTGRRTVDWHYPSRLDCMKCHNTMGGSTLGPETAQMNRTVSGQSQNQIDRMAMMGMFDTAPAKPYKAALVTPYTSQAGMPPAGATTEDKARSYLHANCAFCHRPDGDYPYLDMRHDVAFADMHLCNVDPMRGDAGIPGALNLTPGMPQNSVMYLRVTATPDSGIRMPQIATYVVDDSAATLLGDWITSITTCP